VSGVRNGSERSEVVDPVEMRGGERNVEPSEEKVDGVRVFGSKGGGEGTSDPGSGGGRAEFGVGSEVVWGGGEEGVWWWREGRKEGEMEGRKER